MTEGAPTHPLILGQCSHCGLAQLLNPAPPELVKPPSLMQFSEPQGHLDVLVDRLVRLPGISPASRICGVTREDATTLERLHARGYRDTALFTPDKDLQIHDPCAGLETIQARFTPAWAETLVNRHGEFDIVIVRRCLEHAHNLKQLVGAIKRLIAPQGYVVFEVPDCTTMFDVLDYSFVWEEHVAYFTPETLVRTLRSLGLSPEFVVTYPSPLEGSLVVVARYPRGSAKTTRADQPVSASEVARVARYVAEFPTRRRLWQEALGKLQRQHPVALLGAGHLAVTFINLLGLEPLIDAVCDDAPDKVNRFIPGTQLRISPSNVLLQHSFGACLMAVAPESEPKVLARNQEFIQRGGRFASIFPASDHALRMDAAEEEWDES